VPNFAPIPGDSDDARAVRTRGELSSALIALMHVKRYDDITVQNICERADVGRSTFYAHFQDKDELFVRHTVVFGRALGNQLSFDDTLGCYRFPARGLFEHVRQMKPVFDSLSRARKTEFIMKVLQNNIAGAFEARVRTIRGDAPIQGGISAVILAQHLAGTLITLILWWMDHHYSVAEQEMDQQFHRLIAGLR
jgi:AcrR family transcriptional regulator